MLTATTDVELVDFALGTVTFYGGRDGSSIGVAYVPRETISNGVVYGQFPVFMDVLISIITFPFLARILVELKLLTTDVEQMAMVVAIMNDVVARVLLALTTAHLGSDKSPIISVWVLLCGVAFVVFIMVVVTSTMT
eukprot:Gb_38733 [translate_table: standard]